MVATGWYKPKSIANILSLKRVADKYYHVAFDSKNGGSFIVRSYQTGQDRRRVQAVYTLTPQQKQQL